MSSPASSTPSGASTPSVIADPSKAHLQVAGQNHYSGSEQSLHRIKNVPGYTTPVFKGKEEQRAKVQANVTAKVRETCFRTVFTVLCPVP